MSPVDPLPFWPDAVVFDMDGLMLDSERAITDCMARAAAEAGHALPQSLWLDLVGTGEAACREILRQRLGAAAADAMLAHADTLYDVVVDAGMPHRPGIVALLDWLELSEGDWIIQNAANGAVTCGSVRNRLYEYAAPVISRRA